VTDDHPVFTANKCPLVFLL